MNKKILLIEDNKEMRENTSEILELSNYKVFTAENGKAGVELAQKEKPDLIICDIMMPVLDGYGVLHLLSRNKETANIPFIFLSARAERSDFRKGMEMGADDYVTKPFDDVELLSAIESRLKKSELLKKEYDKSQEGFDSFIKEVKSIEPLKKLSEKHNTSIFKKKQLVYNEGNSPKAIYFIKKGKVKTFRTNEMGKELINGLYNEGDFFGYLSLLEDGKYSDTASTLEDSEITMIPKDDFFALVYKSPEVSRKFINILSNNILEREEQLIKLAYNSVRKRVAEALLTLYSKYKKDNEEKFSMAITREDLATLVGTATETVIRTLSDFKDEKLIEISGGTVSIINPDKLSKLKN
ncbi:MAG: transcriptional regulator [Bacteroidetes bacterium]|jgi:DNA-binding response OmpR family regulator|nr:transcriptional regulator [Bacteroidota bacterium]